MLNTDRNNLLTGEMLTLGLLGKAFYSYPERQWLQSLVDGDVFSQVPFASDQPAVVAGLGILQEWSKKNHGGIPDQEFDDLRADYTRLFIGPGMVLTPPWESVHFSDERLTFQVQTLHVREWYRRFGLQTTKLYQEPDDHIGLEFEFVAHLARMALSALEQKDQARFDELMDAQHKFLAEHLLRWVPALCADIQAKSGTDFYRGIALLSTGVLKQLAMMFDLKVSAEENA